MENRITTAKTKVYNLRERHHELRYRGFAVERHGADVHVTYDFVLTPDVRFAPQVVFYGVPEDLWNAVPAEELWTLLLHVGLSELPSYWKAACPPRIVIESGGLTPAQCQWWSGLLKSGLSEFYFVNELVPEDVPFTIDCIAAGSTGLEAETHRSTVPRAGRNSVLVPIGGGKDSVVSLEILRSERTSEILPFVLNTIPSADSVLHVSGLSTTARASRTISPELLRLNTEGYLNGHVPFSASLAFIGLVVARLHGCGEIALSNERSANEGNTVFRGMTVNHQYSKGFEFESSFRNYITRYLSSDISYFSLLRPLYELQIAAIFATFPAYLPVFKSCNRGIKTNSWCGSCPKCLFAFSILSPFVSPAELSRAFGKNLFEQTALIPAARELVGLEPVKPLECVGTRDETLASLFLASRLYPAVDLPPILAHVAESSPESAAQILQSAKALLRGWDNDNFLASPHEASVRAATAVLDPFVQRIDEPAPSDTRWGTR